MSSDFKNLIPNRGERFNSCLIGANSYQMLSDKNIYETAFLEENVDKNHRNGAEQRYAVIRSGGEPEHIREWLILFDLNAEDMERLAQNIEIIQAKYLCRQGFIWPFDLIWSKFDAAGGGSLKGYVVFPYDRARFYPIRQYLMDSSVPRWKLSLSLFKRIKELHGYDITLNGFSREQVRVERSTNEIWLCLNEYITKLPEKTSNHRLNSFLGIPDAIEERAKASGKIFMGKIRDIYSAAVLSFYLLFYVHPFVGRAYIEMLPEQHITLYNRKPVYIFDPSPVYTFGSPEGNTLANLQFDHEIRQQWERAIPELKALFNGIFIGISHPEELDKNYEQYDWFNIDKWIECLEKDAAVNDNENSRSVFLFDAEVQRRV